MATPGRPSPDTSASASAAGRALPVLQPDAGGGCAQAEPFALQVLDDAMEPEFARGCVIVVDPAGHVRTGAYVMAEVGGELWFRQLDRRAGGYLLRALNPGYAPVPLAGGLGSIRGVVIQRAGRRRRDRKRYD